ncbi:MAG: deoxyhypusine synthase [Elusimicrobia bacterium CG08_land_8_20_14_0_20_59_10]|nr:MAG: deoxyhypusine synthase [Elusimicrobia bacterium CG08_land_8_20_14_0_20_59_10]
MSRNSITGTAQKRQLRGKGTISSFINHNFRHFNALVLKDASRSYSELLAKGGKMFLAMAGAMSTGELGITLAEMIRRGKIHGISCTGANLEEDVFNLVAGKDYVKVPHYRDLSPEQERELLKKGLNRVTDTCIPQDVMYNIEDKIVGLWKNSEKTGRRKFPHEFFYELLLSGTLKKHYQTDPANSWMLAAAQKNLPIFVPGWEDSTLGNVYAAKCIKGELKPGTMKGGIEYMMELAGWYSRTSAAARPGIGFFQIGGGIAGDFPICVVPMITCDLRKKVKMWSYFCQISDSITSFGSYSGAVPNEKITWGKLDVDTPKFVIESDATIVAPLMFSYILDR